MFKIIKKILRGIKNSFDECAKKEVEYQKWCIQNNIPYEIIKRSREK